MDEDDFENLMEMQRMMASELAKEDQVDKKVDILDLIRTLTNNGEQDVQTEQVIVRASQEGYTEQEIITTIDELEKDRAIQETKTGYLNLR